MKTSSAFFSQNFISKVQKNCNKNQNLNKYSEGMIEDASFYLKKSYDETWNMMFSSNLKRSHMVLSGGVCPSCKKDVHMYNWIIDPVNNPWKLTCPHCDEMFPKNDFKAFYDSGLNTSGLFTYEKADKSLLKNPEDTSDFGVDDGFGYTKEGNTWWFVATYLVYGQWWGLIIDGIVKLANAYVVTGNISYAERVIILLDRIADLFPNFDYHEQGIMYEEQRTSRGYVSYWGTSNFDIYKMAIAYDQVFDAVKKDNKRLTDFLNKKAKRCNLKNKKKTFRDIQENIETRIFKDILNNVEKIRTEYTKLAVTLALPLFVLGGQDNIRKAEKYIDDIFTLCTEADGVIGQKGSYVKITTEYIAQVLSLLNQNQRYSIEKMLTRYPNIYDSFKIHIDAWCLDRYYPGHGDDSRLGTKVYTCYNRFDYKSFGIKSDLLNWYLYKKFDDISFIQSIYISNNYSTDGLFEGEFNIEDPDEYKQEVLSVISENGKYIKRESIDKKKFKMALLHSGEGKHRRSLFLDYDSGGMHAHEDALNIEIYAKGMHLMPDLGYPPVNCGGWSGKKFNWYKMPASHNIVVVDGKRHKTEYVRNEKLNSFLPKYGKTVLWEIEDDVKAVLASCPECTKTKRSERLVALIDVSKEDAYVLDIYRTVGGKDHARFLRNGFSDLKVNGLNLKEAPDYGYETFMRNFKKDDSPQPGWIADFKCDESNPVMNGKTDINLRYTCATKGSSAYTCESYVCRASKLSSDHKLNAESRYPTIMERVTRDNNTKSAFAGILEPYENKPFVKSVKRLDIKDNKGNILSDMNVAIKVVCKNRCDVILAKDVSENASRIYAGGFSTCADLCIVRLIKNNIVNKYEFHYDEGWKNEST